MQIQKKRTELDDLDKVEQKKIAANIKAHRLLNEKSVEEFALHMGLSVAMIRKIESGQSAIYAHKAKRIAKFLGTSVVELLSADAESENKSDNEVVILRKEIIITAEKLADIKNTNVRRNITNMINSLSAVGG